MRLFKRSDLWDTLDDVSHYNGSQPWYSSWRGIRFGEATAVILLFVVIGVFGNMQDQITQTLWIKVKLNDKIFADSMFVSDTSHRSITLYRKIRPVNMDDINKMDIPRWQKLKLIAQIDTNAEHNKPLMIPSQVNYFNDDMFKGETACIGTFIKRDSVTAVKPDEGMYSDPQKWFAIAPNLTIADTNSYPITIPEKYTYADAYFYTDLDQIVLVEATVFTNLHSKLQQPGKTNKQLKNLQ